MNSITTRSIAALAATGALVAGGAAAASATTDDGNHPSGATPERSEVAQLVHGAVEDGTVTLEEENVIKQAIEDNSDVEFTSLDEGAAAANVTNGDGELPSGDKSERSEVAQLVHDAVEDGTVTLEEENVIKQSIEDHSDVEFESLDEAAQQG